MESYPGDELEWIDQQVAGVLASMERLRSEIAAYENQLARLYAAREADARRPVGAVVIPFAAIQPRPGNLS